MRFIFKWFFRLALFIAWFAMSVAFGGAVLAAKEALGINVFSKTGYHAFERCLVQETKTALKEMPLGPLTSKLPFTEKKKQSR